MSRSFAKARRAHVGTDQLAAAFSPDEYSAGVSAAVELVLSISSQSRYARVAQRNCAALLTCCDSSQIRFEVCDIAAHPERADQDAVFYTPTLVKRSPSPRTYVMGDMSHGAALMDILESCGLEPRR